MQSESMRTKQSPCARDSFGGLTGWARRQLVDARRLRAETVAQRRRVERMGAELRAVAS